MGIIAYKGRPVLFLLMNLHIVITNTLVCSDHLILKRTLFLNIEVESDDDGHLELIDTLRPGRRIKIKMYTKPLTVNC